MLSFTCRVCCQQQQPRRVSGGQGSGQNRLGSFASERIMIRSGRRRKYFAVRKHAAGVTGRIIDVKERHWLYGN